MNIQKHFVFAFKNAECYVITYIADKNGTIRDFMNHIIKAFKKTTICRFSRLIDGDADINYVNTTLIEISVNKRVTHYQIITSERYYKEYFEHYGYVKKDDVID